MFSLRSNNASPVCPVGLHTNNVFHGYFYLVYSYHHHFCYYQCLY